MNDFVEECRREWQRLGVPDAVANEMSADLAADLREAEAEGGSAEDVVGTGAFDPKAFAAAWAFERGVTGRATPPAPVRRSRSSWAIAACALVAIIGATLLVSSGATRVAQVAAPAFSVSSPAQVLPPKLPPGVKLPPGLKGWTVGKLGVTLSLPAPRMVKLGAFPPQVVAFDVGGDDQGRRATGALLLIVGLGGILLVALFGWAAGRRPAFRA